MKTRNQNRKHKDLTGRRFGKRTVRKLSGKHNGHLMWQCVCACGQIALVSGGSLTQNRATACRKCGHYRVTNPRRFQSEYRMLSAAKCRAKKRGMPFNIDVGDVVIPERCPLLGLPIIQGIRKRANNSPNSPSLDRKIPTLGYVKGNVWVISKRANVIKNDASIEDLENLLRNWKASI